MGEQGRGRGGGGGVSIKSRDCSANNAERLVARRRARPGGQKFGTLQKRPREQLSASKMEAAGAAAPSTTRSRPLTFVNILTSFNVRFACGTVVWPVVQRGAWPETGPECLEGC